MIRVVKILFWIVGMSLLLVLGGAAATFFSRNPQWVPLSFPYPRLSFTEPFGVYTFEMKIGVLAAGWLIAVLMIVAAAIVLPLYLRRTRQYMKTIKGLENELVELRNLPFKAPAPLEDLPDEPVHETPMSPEDEAGDLLQEELGST